MGFWDITSKAGKLILSTGKVLSEEMNKKAIEIKETQIKYQEKTDDELIKIAKNDAMFGNTSTEKSIAKKILINRGVEISLFSIN